MPSRNKGLPTQLDLCGFRQIRVKTTKEYTSGDQSGNIKMSDLKMISTLESRMTLHFISCSFPITTVLFGICGTASYPDPKGIESEKHSRNTTYKYGSLGDSVFAKMR